MTTRNPNLVRACAMEMLDRRALMSAGAIDTAYGTNGLASTGESASSGATLIVQPDGKAIVTIDHRRVERFDAAGKLDASFGNGGTLATTLDVVSDVALGADGTVFLSGRIDDRIGVERFTSSGQRDAAFNGTGLYTMTFNGPSGPTTDGYSSESGGELAIDSAGRAALLTFSRGNDFTSAHLVRLAAAGKLDLSFSDDGSVSIGYASDSVRCQVQNLRQAADGSYVIAGVEGNPYNSDSNPPTNLDVQRFSNAGNSTAFVRNALPYYPFFRDTTLTLQPDGKAIVSLDRFESDPADLYRFNANLTLDTSFGNAGNLEFTSGVSTIQDVAVQTDGKLLVGTLDYEKIPASGGPDDYVPESSGYRLKVRRLTATGAIDASYGTGGIASTPLLTGNNNNGAPAPVVGDIALGADGRLLAVGAQLPGRESTHVSSVGVGLTRLLGDATVPAGSKLAGTGLGTAGSFSNGGNTFAKALDGSLATYFDGPSANGNFVGLDLGKAYTITGVAYAGRSGFETRVRGGIFQGSNAADFSGAVTLYTVGSNETPSAAALTTQTVSNAGTFRYVRYLSPNGSYGNVSEVQFFGTPAAAPPPASGKLTGTGIGNSGSFQNSGNTFAKALDGDLSTYYDAIGANGNVVGLDLGGLFNITSIAYASRAGFASRMNGGIFQVSNNSTFNQAVTIYTVGANENPSSSTLTTRAVSASGYRYVRYLAPNGSYGNASEIQFFGAPSAGTDTRLTGTVIGTPGSFQNGPNTNARAVDGDLATYFDGAKADGNWVGYDLGSNRTITQIGLAARGGWEGRTIGGKVQISSTADFSGDVTTLFTITAALPSGTLTMRTLAPSVTARYVRYLSPNGSYGNISEFEVFG